MRNAQWNLIEKDRIRDKQLELYNVCVRSTCITGYILICFRVQKQHHVVATT